MDDGDDESNAKGKPRDAATAAALKPAAPRPSAESSPSAGSPPAEATSTAVPASAAAPPPPAVVLGGRYELVRQVGAGGMGEVWEARDLELRRRRVAVKRIGSHLPLIPEVVQRFQVEVDALARLERHGNVVGISSHGRDESGRPFIVMDWVDGESLSTVLAREGRLPLERALRLVEEVLDGLESVHSQGILHRDLKPANIMVTATGGREHALIVDFGIAKSLDTATRGLTETGHRIGTPGFMSPEQERGEVCDARSDVYQVGLVLYELLVGPRKRPGSGAATSAGNSRVRTKASVVVEGIPGWVDAVIEKATARSPEARFQSASEMRVVLENRGEYDVDALKPGTEVEGKFVIERRLGRGGFGVVYAAEDRTLKRRCAIKFFVGRDGPWLERFERERELQARLKHPNIPPVYTGGRWHGFPFLVAALAPGRPLREAFHLPGWDWARLVAVMRQVGAALDALHAAGVYHRDVTPENILVADDGSATLIDLGLAREVRSEVTRETSMEQIGRPGYVAPEVAWGEVSAQSDQWSLAAVAYEWLHGRPPHKTGDPETDHPEDYRGRLESGPPPPPLPDDVEENKAANAAILRALALEPTHRFPSVSAFVDGLASAAPMLEAGAERSASSDSTPLALAHTARNTAVRLTRRRLWIGVGVVTVAGAVIGNVITFGGRGQTAPSPAVLSASASPAPASEDVAREPVLDAAPAPNTSAPGAAVASDTGPSLVRVRVEVEPTDATLVVDGERVQVPAELERPAGAELVVSVERRGYVSRREVVRFDVARVERWGLVKTPRRAAGRGPSAPARPAEDSTGAPLIDKSKTLPGGQGRHDDNSPYARPSNDETNAKPR